MRYAVIALCLLSGAVRPAIADVNIGIGLPNVSIGMHQPFYPEFERVPDYPVYYAPRVAANLFFYDGLYWVFYRDEWYASSWYDGPWSRVSRWDVPVFVLRVPVRYYRYPPRYFHGWQHDAPPRWGDHWGQDWRRRRGDWDRWDRRSAPQPAPLPVYQRQYPRDRYPSYEQQRALNGRNYRYQPREPVVQRHYQQYVIPRATATARPGQLRREQRPPGQGPGGDKDRQHGQGPR